MTDLVRLAYYPFLPGVRDAMRELGPSIQELLEAPAHLGARKRALARVEGALGDKRIPPVDTTDDASALQEILSVAVARMLVVAIADRTLARRYAEAEAARVEGHLVDCLRPNGDPRELDQAAEALELPLRSVIEADGREAWALHFADYLRVAPAEDEWKLVLRPILKGRIALGAEEVAHLCREALARRIGAELQAEFDRPLPPELKAGLQILVDIIQPKLEEARQHWGTGDFGPPQPGLFPPCMTALFEQMSRGEMIPHHGRFAFAAFMATIGFDAEGIMDYLSKTPNFDRSKSEYQIKHIAGEGSVEAYTPPGCSWMQTNGVCPLERRDTICYRVKHPLSYYRSRLRLQKRDQEQAAQMVEAAKAKRGVVPQAESGPPRSRQGRGGGA